MAGKQCQKCDEQFNKGFDYAIEIVEEEYFFMENDEESAIALSAAIEKLKDVRGKIRARQERLRKTYGEE